jgi:hypothetical protein
MNPGFCWRRWAIAGCGILCLLAVSARAQVERATVSHGAGAAAEIKAAAAKPTPRTSDGHPDLSGYWDFPQPSVSEHTKDGVIYASPFIPGGNAPGQMQGDPNPPPYKPELLAKVKQLEKNQTHADPAFHCKPLGVPRVGPPRQVIQTAKLVAFFYQVDIGEGDQSGIGVRLIPTDGRAHRKDVDPMYFGDSVGHWEGDTLVVDVNHLTEDTWLGISGYFHSSALQVIERYTRKGDTLIYEATVEDPMVLTKPWIMTPQTVRLEEGMVVEQPPCEERDEQHLVNDDHHTRDY